MTPEETKTLLDAAKVLRTSDLPKEIVLFANATIVLIEETEAQAARIEELKAEQHRLTKLVEVKTIDKESMRGERDTPRAQLDALRGRGPGIKQISISQWLDAGGNLESRLRLESYVYGGKSLYFENPSDCNSYYSTISAAPAAPAQLAELQSGDELPELPPIPFIQIEENLRQWAQSYARQAQAIARSKMLAELGKVEAVAWQCRRRDNEEGWGLWRECSSAEAVRFQTYGPNYEVRSLYIRPLPAQDVNAELVEALELALVYWKDRQQRYKNRAPVWVESARTALANAKAAQQKGGV